MRMIRLLLSGLLLLNTTTTWANAEDVPVTGHKVVYIQDVSAYTLPGSPDNNIEHKNTCMDKFSWILGNVPIEIDYKIFVRTNMQSATVKLRDSTVTLSPMGIANTYSFLTQRGITEPLKALKIRQIYFKLNTSFVFQKLAVSFTHDDLPFQCIAVSTY